MAQIELFHNSFIDVYHDPETAYLHADWKGYQSVDSVHRGCEGILEAMIREDVDSVLNDNTHVLGIWRAAAEWVADDWFPRMRQAGLRRFAWTYSPSRLSQVSTDTTVALMDADAFGVKVFHTRTEAAAWLDHDPAESVQKRRPRVLVVDDNQDFSEIFHSMLHIMGCNPEVAGTATAGLDAARRAVPEMIFCDIDLRGELDGYDFAQAVRADKLLENIPLIAVSGFTSDQDKARAVGAGFDRVFPKPVKFIDISKVLENFAHGRQAAQ